MPPEEDNRTNARSEALERFPAEIDFVHLRSVDFDAQRLPPRVTGEDVSLVPDTWDMTISVQDTGEGKYLVEVEAEAVFETDVGDSPDNDSHDERADAPPYTLCLSAIAGVRTDNELPDELIEQWLEKGLQYLLIPYLRSFISSVVRKSGFDVPYFPLLAVPILYQGQTGQDPDAG